VAITANARGETAINLIEMDKKKCQTLPAISIASYELKNLDSANISISFHIAKKNPENFRGWRNL
jgi:hypothetical protein